MKTAAVRHRLLYLLQLMAVRCYQMMLYVQHIVFLLLCGNIQNLTMVCHVFRLCRYLSRPPLSTDSRRRADRYALQQREMTQAAGEKSAIEEDIRQQRKVSSWSHKPEAQQQSPVACQAWRPWMLVDTCRVTRNKAMTQIACSLMVCKDARSADK